MNEPQGAQETVSVESDGTTLTDEEIETRWLDTTPRASVDDESDPGDADDTGDDTGDEADPSDTGDDTGDEADPSDTGDDSGDDSGDSDA